MMFESVATELFKKKPLGYEMKPELEEWVYMILQTLINEPTKENAKIIAKVICA